MRRTRTRMAVPLGALIFAGIAGGYLITSLLLLRFPTLIHKKKKLKFRCRHISHRGGAAENLENTLSAFHHAVACGTEMLELDVQLTADEQVVVSHDNHLLRVAGEDVHISDINYEDLFPLKDPLAITFEPGLYATSKNGDRRIPLLREVFEQFPNIPINLDVKEDNDKLIEKVYELICEFNRKDITAWGNARDEVCAKLYKLDPTSPLIFSRTPVIRLVLLFYTGMLPFVEIKESLLELPIIDAQRVMAPRLRWLFRFVLWLPLSPIMFRHLERRGIQTYLWVLNNDDDFDYAFNNLGVAGVMTDYPSKLQAYLERQKKDSTTRLVDN